MKNKKVISIILCCIMLISCTGCGNKADKKTTSEPTTGALATQAPAATGAATTQAAAEKADPFGGYTDPITLTTIIHQTVTQTCPKGLTIEDNPWQTLWKSKGINVKYAAVAADNDDVASKVHMAVLSGKLPDYFCCNYATYKELQEAGKIADLTDLINEYGSDDLKSLMNSDGGIMMANVTENGRIYGITQPADYLDNAGVVAIRTDWMKKLNLQAPKNFEDIWNIAKAFKDNKMDGTCTIGIGATAEVSNAMLPMRYMINAYGGYTGAWIEKDGQLQLSLIQPETKAALGKLHEKYAEGLLDKEYGTKKEANLFEDAVAGKCGVVVENFTSPFYLDNGVKLGQEWGFFPLYAEDGTVAKSEQSTGFGSCVVVSKDCKHPEAVIKLFNMFIKYGNEEGETYGSNGINNLAYPTIITTTGKNSAIYKEYMDFIKTGKEPEKPTADYKSTIKQCEDWRLNKKEEGRILYTIFGENSTESIITNAIDNDGYLMSKFTGAPGEAMTKNGANLSTLADQMITYIINGSKDISYFDEFVKTWKASGGDAITKEVNEWYAAQNQK